MEYGWRRWLSRQVNWRIFTDAEPEVKVDQVTLRTNDSQITLKRIRKTGGWSTRDAKPPAEKVSVIVEIQP